MDIGLSAVISGMSSKKVFRRDPLNVDEKQLIGNPAWGAVTIGDPVVKANELSAFVDHLAGRQQLTDE